MKDLKVIIVAAIFLVVVSGSSLMAQGRQTRTAAAKAAYGYPTGEFKAKKKKKHRKKRQKSAKAKNKQPAYRKKNPWAN
jgi:hypothetical protein